MFLTRQGAAVIATTKTLYFETENIKCLHLSNFYFFVDLAQATFEALFVYILFKRTNVL